MTATARVSDSIYRGISDEALAHELQVLARRVTALRLSDTAAGHALHREFSKRLDEARAEAERRRV